MIWYKVLMLILALVLTPILCFQKPELHKPFVLENEGFKLQKTSQEPAEMQTLKLMRLGEAPVDNKKLIAQKPKEFEPIKTHFNLEPSEFYQYANREKPPAEEFIQYQNDNSQQEEFTNTLISEEMQPEIPLQKDNSLKSKIIQRKEETIAWNKWRSDLQNQIMKDAPVSAPLGTLFMFSFKVDKDRRVSNIKVLSSNPFYQKEAVDIIIPVIKSYEGQDILKFPLKTRRKSVKFDGSYMIWFTEEFSSPANFNDLERIQYYE